MCKQAIGVIDSGVGGLSIAKAVHKLLPNENLIYIADSKYSPYGDKSTEQIHERVSFLIEKLTRHQVKAIVIACNTATVNLIGQLRQKYSLPIIGVEPGVKPAVTNSKSRKVGVLATESTISSQAFLEFLERFRQQCDISLTPCPKFVPLIEQGQMGTEQAQSAVSEYLIPLMEQGCDQIVLGCTHYPFLLADILRHTEGKATIIDTSHAVAKQTKAVLTRGEILNHSAQLGAVEFYTTGELNIAQPLFSQLWQKSVEVRHFA